jgi:hypothetical protein
MKVRIGILVFLALSIITLTVRAQLTDFMIQPYLYATDADHVHVAWQYTAGSKLNTSTLAIQVDHGANSPVTAVQARNDNGLWIADLPISTCGFGTFRYLIPGMSTAQVVTAVPCPATGSTARLAFVADAQEYPEYVKTLADQIGQQSVTALLNDGDLVQTGDSAEDWLNYFSATAGISASTIMFPAIGNHEYRSTPQTNLWSHYFQLPAAAAHYSFFVGDAHIMVLNSNFTDDPSQVDSQIGWLQGELAKSAQWKIVMFHHAVYCKGFFNSPLAPKKEYQTLQEKYVPLFEAAHVDVVLNGHDHVYERSIKNGITYLVSGPAGGDMGFYATSNSYSQFSSLERTVTYIDVSAHKLSANSLNLEGKSIDTFSLSK